MGIAGTPGFGGRGRPVTVWTMNASAPPGSSVSYMVSATPCSSVQWKDWPKVTGTALARLQASPQPDPGPPDVHDLSFLGCATALGKLAGLRVQADRPLERESEADGQHARAAADIQKPAIPIKANLPRQEVLQLREYAGRP